VRSRAAAAFFSKNAWDAYSFFSFVFFSLYERKKDKHMIEKYHAAAG